MCLCIRCSICSYYIIDINIIDVVSWFSYYAHSIILSATILTVNALHIFLYSIYKKLNFVQASRTVIAYKMNGIGVT